LSRRFDGIRDMSLRGQRFSARSNLL